MQEMKLKVGDPAPQFVLPDQFGNPVDTKEFDCKNILISFHPLAFTGVCEIQMKTLELKKKELEELNTVALGVSVDSVYAKKAWADSINVKETQLLADFWPHGDVAKKFEQFIEKAGVSGRANILINHNQEVVWIKRYEITEVPDIEEVIKEIKKL